MHQQRGGSIPPAIAKYVIDTTKRAGRPALHAGVGYAQSGLVRFQQPAKDLLDHQTTVPVRGQPGEMRDGFLKDRLVMSIN